MGTLGRFIFWDFKRGSWQYDVMVGLILAFIFLTPRSFFRDQPKPASIVMLPAQQGFLLDTKLLDGVAPESVAARATQLVNQRFKIHTEITGSNRWWTIRTPRRKTSTSRATWRSPSRKAPALRA